MEINQSKTLNKAVFVKIAGEKANDDAVVAKTLDEFPRFVSEVVSCIEPNKSTLKKDLDKIKTDLAICENFSKFKDQNIFLDFKRSGDALQAMMSKKLNDQKSTDNSKKPDAFYIFVTKDHLAFTKARLHNVPALYATTDECKKVIVMFNPLPPNGKGADIARLKQAKKQYEAALSIYL